MDRRRFLHRSAGMAAASAAPWVAGCQSGSDGHPGFAQLRDRYLRHSLALNPVTSTYLGGEHFDPALAGVNGRLRDYSPAAITAELAFLEATSRSLEAFGSGLTAREQVDRSVMRAQVNYVLRRLRDDRHHEVAADSYGLEPVRGVDFQLRGLAATAGGRRGTEQQWRLIVDRLRAIPGYLEVARDNLIRGRTGGRIPDRRLVEQTRESASSAATHYQRELPVLASGQLRGQPFGQTMANDLAAAARAAGEAYQRYDAFLADAYDPADAVDRFAIGEENYAWRLQHCFLERRSTDALFAQTEEWVREREEAVWRVAEEGAREARLGLRFDTPASRRASTRAVVSWLNRQTPRSDEEWFGWVRDAIARAIDFGRERALFDIPPVTTSICCRHPKRCGRSWRPPRTFRRRR